MQIQPMNNTQACSFKAISTIKIPKQNGSSQRLVVKVNHDGDFYSLKWHQVVIETLDKGKTVARRVFGDKGTVIPPYKAFVIMDYIDKIVGGTQNNSEKCDSVVTQSDNNNG